jgi:hypothetical protein
MMVLWRNFIRIHPITLVRNIVLQRRLLNGREVSKTIMRHKTALKCGLHKAFGHKKIAKRAWKEMFGGAWARFVG